MKKQLTLLSLFLLFANIAISQIHVNLTDLKTKETVAFEDIYSTYNLNKELPTVIITWSGLWCGPCISLINRYHKCDLSMINLITINIDKEDVLEDVLKEGFHSEWDNSVNFHANFDDKKSQGFNSVFNTSSGPLILILKNGVIDEAVTTYKYYPSRLIEFEYVNDINFIWNNSVELNSIAWDYYLYGMEPEDFEKAKKYAIRSVELDKNYSNLDTYAALLYKTGEYTQALKTAKQAIELAKKNGEDHTVTTELINKIIEKL